MFDNSIFLRDGAEVILIPRTANRFTEYQPTIDQVHPQAVSYVDLSLSIFETFNGPYCFIISDRFDGYGDTLTDFLTRLKRREDLLTAYNITLT